MARKSKTQRAKASAARAARKEQAREEQQAELQAQEKRAEEAAAGDESADGKKPFRKAPKSTEASTTAIKKKSETPTKKVQKEEPKKPKKERFVFLKSVRSEMRRVTWPTKQDVLRWSGVVVVALLFFGLYVAGLDNLVVLPVLSLIAGLGVA